MIVTIVTPTLNGMEFLARCIDSVKRNQTPGVQIDHVIVDGGSTDGTVAYAESQGLRVLTGKDKGIFDAINKGSFNSEGQLLGFLGADDTMLEGAVAAIVSAYRRSGRRWVVGGIRWTNENDQSLGELAAPPSWMSPKMHASLGWNPIMHMSTYFSRSFYEELGGFNITFKDSGDYDMFARALSRAPYARIDKPLTCFRRTGKNNSVVNRARSMDENRLILEERGPKSASTRFFLRTVLKSWLNIRNPHWTFGKLSGKLQRKLHLRESAYF
ncbi:glycosyltransferase family 2 protein [Methylobacterium flocculans]|uniref:glycosyltransferase family 2 protein n=1 Tax=Methylobacterium flocculans TaxID=2984843 RepID=UPI0021F3A404|nr:glycosyltransferase family 2 protein [Methylobacterium sp. FF17]